MDRELRNILKDSPEISALIRLKEELEKYSIDEIKSSLEFELTMYKQVPELIERNYMSIDHLLAYISKVDNL